VICSYRVEALELLELTLFHKSQNVIAGHLDVPVVLGKDVHNLCLAAVVTEPKR
jgi:hypothetical protein